MNTCFFEGFVVGKKPMKVSNNGKDILPFGLSILINPQATNTKEKSTIFNFVAFDRTAHHIDDATNGGSNYLHIQATPKVNRYTDANGNEHSNTVFWVSSATRHTVISASNRTSNKATNNRNEPLPTLSAATAGPKVPAKNTPEDGYEDFV
jgi:single-stranded DNA-binding protein